MTIRSNPRLDAISETPKILYGDYQLKRIKQKKILGLIIDDQLKWNEWTNQQHKTISILDKRELKMFKVLKGMALDYLKTPFHVCNNTSYPIRTNNLKIYLPKPKTNFLKKSFDHRGAASWNKLPSDLIREVLECKSVNSFLEFVINLILNVCSCTIQYNTIQYNTIKIYLNTVELFSTTFLKTKI